LTETRTAYQTQATAPTAHTWHDILCRLRGIGDEVPRGCAARVTLIMMVRHGMPVQWFEPKIERLEPERAARQFVEWVDG